MSGTGWKKKAPAPPVNNNPQVLVTQECDDYLQEVCNEVDAEVGGLGYIRRSSPDSNIWIVDDVFLLPQEVSHGSVDFKEGAMGMAVEWAFEEGRLDDLRFSWHTHYNFNVFWSGTDENAIRTYLRQAPFLFSLVLNKAGDRLARVDVPNVPVIGQVKIDQLSYKVITKDRTEGRAAEHIAEMVEVQKWTPVQKSKGADKKKAKASEVKQPTDARSYQQQLKREREEREAKKEQKQLGSGTSSAAGEMEILYGQDAADFLAGAIVEEVEEVHGELVSPEEFKSRVNDAFCQLTPSEWEDLEDAGFNPVNMSDAAIDDALVQIRLAEAGLIDAESIDVPDSGQNDDEHSSPLDTEHM